MNLIYTLQKSNFNEIHLVWQNHLWQGRQSPIEPISCIDENGSLDLSLLEAKPHFWKLESETKEIVGVLSGHKTSSASFRSRGLWVHEKWRRRGLGEMLMLGLFDEARKQGCEKVWTMPRQTSWSFYEKMQFQKRAAIHAYEFGPHYLADYQLKG